jgi:hypothetical protein
MHLLRKPYVTGDLLWELCVKYTKVDAFNSLETTTL